MKIRLYNRYGYKFYLEKIKGSLYKFNTEGNYEEEFNTIRVIHNANNVDYDMIDPSGGPYLEVGKEFAGNIIKRISVEDKYFIIEFEHIFKNINKNKLY